MSTALKTASYPYWLAKRLSLADSQRRQSPAIVVAVVATALSVVIMIAALAIVAGFKHEIREKVVGFNSHLVAYVAAQGPTDDNLLHLSPSLRNILDQEPYITSYYLETSAPGVLKTKEDFKGYYFKGVSGEGNSTFLKANLTEGRLPSLAEGSQEVLISRLMADRLQLKAGDEVDSYFFYDNIRARRLKITGIYDTHFDAYDDLYAYGPMSLIADILSINPGYGTSLHIDTDNFSRLPEYTDRLNRRLAQGLAEGELYKPVVADNALSMGASYFTWLNLLDTNVAVILILMAIVACVTLISGQLIIILDKRPLIGLLKTLGTPDRQISKVFVLMALKVAAWGMVIGNALAFLVLGLQQRFHFFTLDPDAYYINFVPVRFQPLAIVGLNLAIFAVIVVSLLLPARLAAKISPAQTLRYE